MSGDPDEPQRTVFIPRTTESSTPPGPATEDDPWASADPAGGTPPEPESGAEATQWNPAATTPPPRSMETSAPEPQAPAPPPPMARPAPTEVGPGVVLNNIYEVKRFLARGGMGEVYEGFNVNTDERVAIKVMLPALAADPNVQAMFRKEARTLTRLHHSAVVQYRVLAQEPQLNVFYIVTEFIDGAALSDMLAELKPTPEEIRKLTRRLAEGLGAAHALGAVHRDMSPDNVLLPDRRLDHAKIIDFGIAKDMDPSKGTIVGDGFAGKLGYVAPEQFGDYDRQVGPWTDVYSLGLVILALIQGRNVDMGATLVEAVDKRRAGPDLSAVPEMLRPVLAGMLAADPQKRLRSMEDVVAALDAIGQAPAASAAPAAKPAAAPRQPKPDAAPAPGGINRTAMIAGGAVLAVVLIGGAAVFALNGAKTAPAATGVAQVSARRAVEAVLPTIGCSWLDLSDLSQAATGVSVRLQGVAGRPATVQGAIGGATSEAKMTLNDLNLDEVAPVGEPLCAALDSFRAVRAPEGGHLSTPQRKFEMVPQDNGKLAARAVINMAPRDPASDFALVGLEPTGKMDIIFHSRAEFSQIKASLPANDSAIADLGGDSYRLQIATDHKGWSGILLVTGKGPFDQKLLSGEAASRGADWPGQFKAMAAKGGWKTDMVWYRTATAGEN